ncbi:hypothetical protein TNCV_3147641 [Trichonephila clavipes]|nr:hypothetical protein TNCV_3147641 [Trichonephila clavipes]
MFKSNHYTVNLKDGAMNNNKQEDSPNYSYQYLCPRSTQSHFMSNLPPSSNNLSIHSPDNKSQLVVGAIKKNPHPQ